MKLREQDTILTTRLVTKWLIGLFVACYFISYVSAGNHNAYTIDNTHTETSFTGIWNTSTSGVDYFGADYLLSTLADGEGVFTWNLSPSIEGDYDVYTWWPTTDIAPLSTGVTYQINHAATSDFITVDQRINGGAWGYLGTYDFTVTDNSAILLSNVTDGTVLADAVKLVYRGKFPPLVNPGAARTSLEDATLTLDGSASSDLDGSITGYQWSQKSGPAVTLLNANTAKVTFTVPTVASITDLWFTLTVTDNEGLNDAGDQRVTIVPVAQSSRVTNNLQALYYFQDGSGELINDVSSVAPALPLHMANSSDVTWDRNGLVIQNNTLLSTNSPATKLSSVAINSNSVSLEVWVTPSSTVQGGPAEIVSIAADASNRNISLEQDGDRYVARLRTHITGSNGNSLSSSAGSVLAEPTHLVYTRNGSNAQGTLYINGVEQVTDVMGGYFANWDESYPLNVVDAVSGGHPWKGGVHLVAFYNRALTPTEITQNYTAGFIGIDNQLPVAHTLADIGVAENKLITLDASTSLDFDGSIASYAWGQISGPAVSMSGVDTATLSFTTPYVEANTQLGFSVEVTDNDNATDSEEIYVDVIDQIQPPVANAGIDQTVTQGATVTIDGSSSHDLDGSLVSYNWTTPPEIVLDNSTLVSPSFTAPNVVVTTPYTLTLEVTDNQGITATDTVVITVQSSGNQLPVANAGTDQTVNENTVVNLNGSSSNDPDGSIASYSWSQIAGPAVTLTGGTSTTPSFTAPDVTTNTIFTFQLTVTDNDGGTATDTINVTVQNVNQLPTANAGTDQTVNENSVVNLNGNASNDPDGSITNYAWSQLAGPTVTLTGGTSATPSFTAPDVALDTIFIFQLTVTDNDGDTATDTINVTVQNVVTNQTPVADAGPDQSVDEGTVATLNGTASSDADGSITGYSWVQTTGPAVTLNNVNTSISNFTAPAVTTNTILTFQLTVTDDQGATGGSFIAVTVQNVNQLPTANSGVDQIVNENTLVNLTGSASNDPDGSITSYAWSQLAGPAVTLTGSTSATPSFTAPDVTTNTILTFQLTVTDNDGATSTDSIDVTVQNVNQLPVANAGTDQSVNENTVVNLNGGASNDPDGSITNYAWSQLVGPTVTLTGGTSATPSFTAPDVTTNTVLTFQLTVTDNDGDTATDTINVTVQNVNQLPVANAGVDQLINENTLVNLTGSASNDPDGSITNYAWSQLAGPAVTLTGGTSATPSFTAPDVTTNTVLTFQLTVTDNDGDTATDTINVSAQNVNQLPVANAGTDQTVNENTVVNLNGSASNDPDGSIASYAWSQLAGPVVTLTGGTSATPSFTAPDVTTNTIFTFQLTVTDNDGDTATDTINVTVQNVNQLPVANAGVDQVVNENSIVNLNGSASNDPDGSIASYAWSQLAGPAITLTGGTSATPSFTAPDVALDTIFTFQLTVTDNDGDTATDTINVTVQDVVTNQSPVSDSGPDQSVDEGTVVTLNGTASSDADGTITDYTWVQTTGPAVTLNNANTSIANFTAPAVITNTILTFQLTVTDDQGATGSSFIAVTVRDIDQPSENNSYSLDNSSTDTSFIGVWNSSTSGADYFGIDYFKSTLADGEGSFSWNLSPSIEGDYDVYVWWPTVDAAQLSTGVSYQVNHAAITDFVNADQRVNGGLWNHLGTYDFTISNPSSILLSNVTDGLVLADAVKIVYREKLSPIAHPGAPRTSLEGATLTLDGRASSDLDGTIASYQWTQKSGPAVTLLNAATANVTFTAPNVADITELWFTLRVTDNDGLNNSRDQKVTVIPVAQSPRVTNFLQALYYFQDGSGVLINDVSAVTPALPLQMSNVADVAWDRNGLVIQNDTLLSTASATKVSSAIRNRNSVSLEVWVTPSSDAQAGPAEIISIATDASNRNISLQQDGDRYVARVRTHITGVNGRALSSSAGSVTTTLTHIVFMRNGANSQATLYINGVEQATDVIGGYLSAWDEAYPLNIANVTGGQPWQGGVHLVALYNHALTPAEVAQNYAAGLIGIENQAPVAHTLDDISVAENKLIALDASTSLDFDGAVASYAWTQIVGPVVTLNGAATATLSLTTPYVEANTQLGFRVEVTDNDNATDSEEIYVDVVNIVDVNQLPIANAGTDQAVNENSVVNLNGGASNDPDGSIASYAWSLIAGPAVTLTGGTSATPSFTAPDVTLDTIFTFQLTVTDNDGDTATDTINVTVQNVAANQLPVASAGPDQNADEGTVVFLNGTASSDADGTITNYTWVQTTGPAVILNNANTNIANFTAPDVTTNTIFTFQLTVTDNDGGTATDTINVTVQNVNQLPAANAGTDQTVNENSVVNLNGSASNDPDGSITNYAWSQLAGPTVTLTGGTSATPSFTAPDVTTNTILTFQLTVTDNDGATSTDSIDVTVQNVNQLPVANAGTDQSVNENSVVNLNGSASNDPDGSIASYAWSQLAGPAVTLTGSTSATPSFTAPAVTTNTIFTFQLTVMDNDGATHTDLVNVTVQNVNQLPVANAGVDQTVNENTLVNLTGNGSSDPDGSISSYAWSQTAGPVITVTGGTTATPNFTTPAVATATVLTFQLTVMDNDGATHTDLVNVTVQNVNQLPVANAGVDQTVNENTLINLTGNGSSDPDGSISSYAWSQTAGPVITVTGGTTATPSFTAPAVTVDTVLTFELTVTDNGGATHADLVSVTVQNVNGLPVANAGIDQTVNENTLVNLDGSVSTDPDGTIASYAWLQLDGPMVTLSGENTVAPSFTAPLVDIDTILTFRLIVTDDDSATSVSDVNITVLPVLGNLPPISDAGQNQTVTGGVTVNLVGTGSSDADGSIANYLWEQTAGPSIVLVSNDTDVTSFTAPTGNSSILRFRLTVTDDMGLADTAYISVTVNNASVNIKPVAYAGVQKTVAESGLVVLNANASYDEDGVIVNYNWEQTGGPSASIDTGSSLTTFVAPATSVDLLLQFTLTVTDDLGLTDTDTVDVVIKPLQSNLPGPVSFLYGIQGAGKNTIFWHSVDNATKYNIYWSTEPGILIPSANKITDVMPPYEHLGLNNGTVYYYKVTAENDSGESVVSDEIKLTTGITGITQNYALKMPVDGGLVRLTYIQSNGKGDLIGVGILNNTLYYSYYSKNIGWERAQVVPGSEGIAGVLVRKPDAVIKFDSTGKYAVFTHARMEYKYATGLVPYIFASVYEHGEGWSSYQEISREAFHDNDVSDYSLDIDSSGNAFFAWFQRTTGLYGENRTSNKINAKYFSGVTKTWGQELIVDPGTGFDYYSVTSKLLDTNVAIAGNRRYCTATNICHYEPVVFVYDHTNSLIVSQKSFWRSDDLIKLDKDASGDLLVLDNDSNNVLLYKYSLSADLWEFESLSSTVGVVSKFDVQTDNAGVLAVWLKEDETKEIQLFSRLYSNADSSWGPETKVSVSSEGKVIDYKLQADRYGNDVLLYSYNNQGAGSNAFMYLNGPNWLRIPNSDVLCGLNYNINEFNEIITSCAVDDSTVVNHYDTTGTWLSKLIDGNRANPQAHLSGEGLGVIVSSYPDSVINYYTNLGDDYQKENSRPLAIIKRVNSVISGKQLVLDGAGSRDIDGQIVEYTWSQVAGQSVAFTQVSPGVISLIAPPVPDVETLQFDLTVVDDKGATDTATISFEVISSDNIPPVITPPPNVTVEATGETTPADIGMATAVDNVDGIVSVTKYPNGPYPLGETIVTWGARDIAGNYAVAKQTITVQDTTPPQFSPIKETVIVVSDRPTSNVILTKPTATDLFPPVYIYNDAQNIYPLGAMTVTWTAVDANYNVSSIQQTVLLISNSANKPPVAISKSNKNIVFEGESFTLSASGSYDQDGDAITYSWRQVQGTVVDIVDNTLSNLTLTAPQVGSTVTAKFELTVTDVNGSSDKAYVVVSFYYKAEIVGEPAPVGPITGTIDNIVVLQANQTYEITSDLIINPGGMLIVEEGVTLLMSTGVGIIANGIIQVNGLPTNPVQMVHYFYRNPGSSNNLWKGITINSGGTGSIIRGAVIESADTSIKVDGAEATVIDNHLSLYLNAAIVVINNSSVIVEGNTIEGGVPYAPDKIGLGIVGYDSAVNIYNNIIRNNLSGIQINNYSYSTEIDMVGNDISANVDGISLGHSYFKSNVISLNENTIDNNRENLYVYRSDAPEGFASEINASRNWWGSINPDDFTSTIYTHQFVAKLVPFLDGPDGNEVIGNYLNGIIESDLIIGVDDNYTVVGTLWVMPTGSVTINPGAIVNFSASSSIYAVGKIDAQGTPDSRIKLTGSMVNPDKRFHETGRIVVHNDDSKISYVDFDNFSNGVRIEKSNLDVNNCTFRNFVQTAITYTPYYPGYESTGKLINVSGNHFENQLRIGTGIYAGSWSGSSFAITKNTFKTLDKTLDMSGSGQLTVTENIIQNNNFGINIIPSFYPLNTAIEKNTITDNNIGIETASAINSITNNQIFNNALYNISSSVLIDARSNWWGTVVDTEIAGKLNGEIRYSPYLDGPQGNLVNATGPYGHIEADLSLAANTEYTLTGTLYIPAGRTLTVEPGVTIRVPDGDRIIVKGNIEILGTENQRVRIIPDNLTPVPGIWQGISIETSDEKFNIFKFVDIQYANYAINATKGKLLVSNSRISNSYSLAIRYYGDYYKSDPIPPEVIVVNSEVYNNSGGVNLSNVDKFYIGGNYLHNNNYGLYTSRVTSSYVNVKTAEPVPHIRSNRIANNVGAGIRLEGDNASGVTENILPVNKWGIQLNFSSSSFVPVIANNDLAGNTSYGILVGVGNYVIGQLDVLDNWWGTVVESEIDTLIFDGKDNVNYAVANYLPILPSSTILQTPVFDDYLVTAKEASFVLSGNAGPNANVNIYNQDDLLLASITSNPSGRFTTTVTLIEGDNIYYTRAESGGVLTDYSLPVTVTLDTGAPNINIVAPIDKSSTVISASTIVGSVSEKSLLTINDVPVLLDLANQFNYGPISLAPGTNTFTLKAVDNSGNVTTKTIEVFLDTTPPPQVNPDTVNLGETVDSVTPITAGAGTAEAGITIQIINSRTGETSQTIVNADGSFNGQIGTQVGDMLFIMAIDAAGNVSAWSNKKVGGLPQSNAITITAPLDETIVYQDLINVRGTFTAPAYSKVTVNGKPALTIGDRFYVNNVSLNSGVNIVEVKIETPDGQIQTPQSIAVTNNSYLINSFNNFYVGVSPDNGMAPLATKFQVIYNTVEPITQITADFDGDGTPDLTTTDLDLLVYTYDQPGEYTANIEIQTANTSESHQQHIVVYSAQQMDVYLRGLYYTMLDQLTLGNITNAMYFLSPTMQDKYQAAFTNLGAQLQTIIPGLGNVVGGSVYGDVAELYLMRDEVGVMKAFPISMIRDRDGRWRISDM